MVNIVHGAGSTGGALMGHGDVDKVAFTGSTGVGRIIMKQIVAEEARHHGARRKGSKHRLRRCSPGQAVEGIINGIFFSKARLLRGLALVEESIADDLWSSSSVASRCFGLKPLDKNTDVGAINSKGQLQTIERYIEVGQREGATCWQSPVPVPDAGYFVPPTLLLGVNQTDTVVREESGPVLSVLTFRTPAEAIKKANDTEYGLACGVWTDKTAKLFEVSHRLNAGGHNGANLFDPTSAFGGVRHSGFGQEGGRLASGRTSTPLRRGPSDAPHCRQDLKMYVGGKFIRSESGRSCRHLPGGRPMNVPRASRKDIRDTTATMRAAQQAGRVGPAYNRGQILYRLAEILDSRAEVFLAEEVAAAADRAVHFAGWTDKIGALLGVNPVAGAYINYSRIAPMGIVVAVPDPRTGSWARGGARAPWSWATPSRWRCPSSRQSSRWPWPRPSRCPMCPVGWSTS